MTARFVPATMVVLFFLSGVTGLIYEVVWSKYLNLILGSTVQAQTLVLAIFMGGLAGGNLLVTRVPFALRHPLISYGCLEFLIGIYGFSFASLYEVGDWLFVAWGTPFWGHPLLLGLKFFISVLLLLVPTLLMGATLPLIASWLQTRWSVGSLWITRFYALNTLGAACGAFLAGFYLVRELGLGLCLWYTGFGNGVIGLLAVVIGRTQSFQGARLLSLQATTNSLVTGDTTNGESESRPSGVQPRDSEPRHSFQIQRVAYLGVASTGAVAMGLEVLTSRCLSLVFGASLQAFAVVLIAFILGIGVASFWISSQSLDEIKARVWGARALFISALVLTSWLVGIEGWVILYRWLMSGIARSEMGYHYHLIVTGFLAVLGLGLPASLIGLILPSWLQVLERNPDISAPTLVGRLLALNTFAAVGGVILTGFVMMPWFGLRASFGIFAVVLGCTSILISPPNQRKRWTMYGGIFLTGLIAVWIGGGEHWKLVMSSGVFRARGSDAHPLEELSERKKQIKLLFYEDAADATVSVEQGGLDGSNQIALRINGKADASTSGDLPNQLLLAHLPLILHPHPKDVFVLGLGSGITAATTLLHPIESLTIAENCEPVIRATECFKPWNRNFLKDPRTHLWNEDARTILKLNPQTYDILICQPSNPWTAGMGSVFSRDFYELAAQRLRQGGLMAQWFHIYELSDPLLLLMFRTFRMTFPYFEIWDTQGGDILVVGSKTAFPSNPSVYHRAFELPQVRADLESFGLKTPASLLVRQLASQSTTPYLPNKGPYQSDENPLLEYEAPKTFFIGSVSQILWKYDERTWFSHQASQEKQEVCRTMENETIKGIFRNAKSVNGDLMKFLTYRFRQDAGAECSMEFDSMPTLFRRSQQGPKPSRPHP